MREVSADSWKEFEEKVDDLEAHRRKTLKVGTSELLFRGQANARWRLTTTLERDLESPKISDSTYFKFPFAEYHKCLQRIKPYVELHTGKEWNLGNETEPERVTSVSTIPGYRLMVYARHHGFPSPLLDWTSSPYIALFFAFKSSRIDDRVAVYVYNENPKGFKFGEQGIVSSSRRTNAHPRHFNQQARYTICCQKNQEQSWFYSSHDKHFEEADDNQDLLVKISLPAELRDEVLRRLDSMNINPYSMFGNEEGLMNLLALRELEEYRSKGFLEAVWGK